MRKALLRIPEYFLIVSVVFYWISSAQIFNPFAIGFITLLLLQLNLKNKVFGTILGSLLILISLYMLLALFSELSEFNSFNSQAKTLLYVGLSYFLTTIAISVVMIYNNINLNKSKN
jgi:hypothetical protein